MEHIKNFNELMAMNRKGEYILDCDIDCEGKIIKCISEDFAGTINGLGHKIINFTLNDEIWGDEQTVAFFKYLTKAEIVDVLFDNVTISFDKSCYNPRVAIFAGRCSNSKIKNVIVHITSAPKGLPFIYDISDCDIVNSGAVYAEQVKGSGRDSETKEIS